MKRIVLGLFVLGALACTAVPAMADPPCFVRREVVRTAVVRPVVVRREVVRPVLRPVTVVREERVINRRVVRPVVVRRTVNIHVRR